MQINGHELYVESHGPVTGRPVVLLHHGLGSVRTWKAQVLALAATGYRVVAYDRWGYGASAPRESLSVPYFEDDLADLHRLLEELHIEQAALVGHSDGGTLALYFAAQHSPRVRCLVAVASHIYVEPKMLPGIEGVRQSFLHDRHFREGLSRAHGNKAEAVFRNWYEGWVKDSNLTWDMRPLLSRVACPALVVQGVGDEHATPQHAQGTAAAIEGAELWLAEGVGHMLPQEIPEEFNRRMLDFLATSYSRTATRYANRLDARPGPPAR